MDLAQDIAMGYFQIMLLVLFTVYPLWMIKRFILD